MSKSTASPQPNPVIEIPRDALNNMFQLLNTDYFAYYGMTDPESAQYLSIAIHALTAAASPVTNHIEDPTQIKSLTLSVVESELGYYALNIDYTLNTDTPLKGIAHTRSAFIVADLAPEATSNDNLYPHFIMTGQNTLKDGIPTFTPAEILNLIVPAGEDIVVLADFSSENKKRAKAAICSGYQSFICVTTDIAMDVSENQIWLRDDVQGIVEQRFADMCNLHPERFEYEQRTLVEVWEEADQAEFGDEGEDSELTDISAETASAKLPVEIDMGDTDKDSTTMKDVEDLFAGMPIPALKH